MQPAVCISRCRIRGKGATFDLATIIVGEPTDFAEYDGAYYTDGTTRRVTAGDLLDLKQVNPINCGRITRIFKYAEKYQGDEREIYKPWKHLLYWQEEIGQLVSGDATNQNRLPEMQEL